MKPENALTFDLNPDLSGYWIYKAQEMIFEILEVPMHKVNFELAVASQNMGESCKIGYLSDIPVTINFEYREDEWSLTGYYYDDEMRLKVFKDVFEQQSRLMTEVSDKKLEEKSI